MELKTAEAKKSKTGQKKLPPKARIYIICLIVSVIFLIAAWVISMMTGGLEIKDPSVGNPDKIIPTESSQLKEPDIKTSGGLTRKNGFYNFLIVGTDKGGSNTDTILLASFDTQNKQVNILQIPRDTLLNVKRSVKKINAAYAYGGIEGLEKDLTNLLGLPVDRYGIINISGFHKVIDAVGGVEVVVPEPGMVYEDETQNLSINIKPGKQTLTGVQAEGFVRFRSGYSDADLGRLKAQKAFISSFIQKLLSPAMIAKSPQFIQIAFENLKTDMKLEDFVYIGTQATKLNASGIHFFTLPGEGVGANFGIYKKETMDMINTYFNPYTTPISADKFDIVSFERQLTGEVDTSGTQLTDAIDTKLSHISNKASGTKNEEPATITPDPKEKVETQQTPVATESIRVKLINTTGNENILTNYMGKLKASGFTIVSATSQTDKTYESTVIINQTKQNLGKNLLKYFPAALIQNDYHEGQGLDVVIMLGEELN